MRRRTLPTALAVLTAVPLTAMAVTTPALARPAAPSVLTSQQISHQVVTPRTGSEPDTLVEPDIAVSPKNARVAVAVSHEGRFADGGATSISHAWTTDAGRTWRFGTVVGLTHATGGDWDRVSDPVLAFDSTGAAYLSTLVFNENDCRTAVLVQRSTDGGATFGAPVTADFRPDCAHSDDKNWIAIDTGAHSPHRDRIYQFWSLFLGNFSQQRVRWSDDHGRTWSADVTLTPAPDASTQDSQVLIQPDGTVTDTYQDFSGTGRRPDNEREQAAAQALSPAARAAAAAAPATLPAIPVLAQTSHDGGMTWSAPVVAAQDSGGGLSNARCCLPSGTVDPATGRMYLAWIGLKRPGLFVASSTDGVHWARLRTADAARRAGDQYVNVDVVARNDVVMVAFGRQQANPDGSLSMFVRQNLAFSHDAGRSYAAPLVVGPVSDLTFAAQTGQPFPGDYTGTAAAGGRFWSVWATSGRPPAGGKFHQTLWAVTVRP